MSTELREMESKDNITEAPVQGLHSQNASQYSLASPSPTPYTEKGVNPFATPGVTPGHSTHTSTSNIHSGFDIQPPTYFHSRRVKKEDISRPWLAKDQKDKKAKWQTLIPMIGLLVGLCISGYLCYQGWTSIPDLDYCLVFQDDFSSGQLDTDVWVKEAEVGGYGNGQFDETTVTDENVFIQDGMLTIMPTLQDANLVETNSVINLTQQGICSSDLWSNCVAVTNTTNGTIVPPAKSGRISTTGKKGASIKYGRVEVMAKLPKGDWLWPAIWMLPVNNTYGPWPESGEIDIAESRGNNHTYPEGGNNIISSTLHWGPDPANDAWWRTFGKTRALMSNFNEKFHLFGLEWTPKYIYMYLDSRLLQVMYNNFNTPLWQRGDFPLQNANGTAYVNPWGQTGIDSTPFDQDFYLILNVAVGGTNGWFQDGVAGKPWVNSAPNAKLDFWKAKDQWYPTWTDPSMQVQSVKMFQQKGYNGC